MPRTALMEPLTLRLPPALVVDFQAEAARMGLSTSELMRQILAQESKKLQEQFDQEDQQSKR